MPNSNTNRKRTTVSKTASSVGAIPKTPSVTVTKMGNQRKGKVAPLTEKEIQARMIKKYSTTTFGFNSRVSSSNMGYSGVGDVLGSQYGNFYSPQLSTDFLEKPQNLRERRAWYRYFYASNEFVGQAIDLHSTLPLSKIRLEKPKCQNEHMSEYIYDFYVDMCNDMKLFKSLLEISHEYNLMGGAFIFSEDQDPYDSDNEDRVRELKEAGKIRSDKLLKEFGIIDKDPNYLGWRKLLVLPPDQVRVKKVPMSDESLIDFIPDPETRKVILHAKDGLGPSLSYGDSNNSMSERILKTQKDVPEKLITQLEENGCIPLDTDPYSGSHVYYLARKKCQYETFGVSILERCINTLLLQDKLRQAQTSIASRHMTPIRIVWAEGLSETDTDALREQVDLALVDPDFSIIANYEVHWAEMGSNGRLLELSTEYEHIENSLFAGLGITREILTGEGTYSSNRMTLEIMNTQYLLFRELIQEYVENYLFKPVAKKKGFVEVDKYGREKLIYPKLSFTRLAIRDNDAFFDQAFQLYNKGSIPIDVILDMMNIDTDSSTKKIEKDLFTVKDFAYNQLMSNVYTAAGQGLVEKYNVLEKLGEYLGLNELPPPPPGAEAGGLSGPMGRFSSDKTGSKKFKLAKMDPKKVAALQKLVDMAMESPDKLEKIVKFLSKK